VDHSTSVLLMLHLTAGNSMKNECQQEGDQSDCDKNRHPEGGREESNKRVVHIEQPGIPFEEDTVKGSEQLVKTNHNCQ
jgi:hypothetical protein